MNDSIQKLIDKYETMLQLKEPEQKKTQEEAKNIKDSVDYGDEQKKKNIKLHLVRLGAEIKSSKNIIDDLKELLKEAKKANYIFVIECNEYSDKTFDITTDINKAIDIFITKFDVHGDICAFKDDIYYQLYSSETSPKIEDKEAIKEIMIDKLKELMVDKE